MATAVAIAKRREDAIRRMDAATRQIGAELGVQAPILPSGGRDPAYQEAERLAVIADWLETVGAALVSAPSERPSSTEEGNDNGNANSPDAANARSRRRR